MRRTLLVAVLAIVATHAALAQSTTALTARSELRRRYLLITGEGVLAGVPSGSVVTARIRRLTGPETALATTFVAGPDGALKLELRTTKRLLPDEYTLEVLAGASPTANATPIASTPFQVGSPAEVAPARARLRSWLVIQRATLRDLSASLERAGSYHRSQLLAQGGRPGGALVRAQLDAWKEALDGTNGVVQRYRVARMDYGVYEREVLLSPFPATTAALSSFFPALTAREKALDALVQAAASGRDNPVPAATAILGVARTSATELGLPPDDEDWERGPLGVPESASAFANGVFTSSLGVTFAIPSSFSVTDLSVRSDDRPEVRFLAMGKPPYENTSIQLIVRELPDTPIGDDLEGLVEMLTWEEFGNNSWKKMESSKGPRTQELRGRWDSRGYPYRLIVVDRAPPEGKRLFELRAMCEEKAWDACHADLEKVAASFALVGK